MAQLRPMNHTFLLGSMLIVGVTFMSRCASKGTSNDPDGALKRRTLDAKICRSVKLPTKFGLAKLDAETSKEVRAAAAEGPFLVRLSKTDCATSLEVVSDCKVLSRYRYRRAPDKRQVTISSVGALWNEMPLAVAPLKEPFSSGKDYTLNTIVAGRYSLDPEFPVVQSAISGSACARATHLVTEVDVGHIGLRDSDAKVVYRVGSAKACADEVQLRPKKCSAPVALSTVPVNEAVAIEPVEMIPVEGGKFLRGPDDKEVELSAFEIDELEVSAAHYAECVDKGACKPAEVAAGCTGGVIGKEEHPINCVDWHRANAYCKFVEKRLPTEAEWEKAARAPGNRKYVWGDTWPPPSGIANFADAAERRVHPFWTAIENYDDGYAGTAPVSAFSGGASQYGAQQMAGNVGEWVNDWYSRNYGGRNRNPTGPRRGNAKVVRGGSFGNARAEQIQVTRRDYYAPGEWSMHIGFRCAK